MTWDVIVVGAGAAGLLAAVRAAERGRRVLVVEKNRKPGVKILMSGGTRCNLTHATDRRGIVDAFGRQGRFLHSSLAALGPAELIELFHAEGVDTKVEDTGKVFPTSDRALDVLQALLGRLRRSGAELALDEAVLDMQRTASGFTLRTNRATRAAPRVILTTGGQSYPGCGTTGDGYAWAAQSGHDIVQPRPALVPLTTHESWAHALSGITIPDVEVRLVASSSSASDGMRFSNGRPGGQKQGSGKKQASSKKQGGNKKRGVLGERRGSFLFTHVGLSGPVVMDISRAVTNQPGGAPLTLLCNFVPDMNEAAWTEALRDGAGKTLVAQIVGGHLPWRVVDAMLNMADVSVEQRLAELPRKQRSSLVDHLTATRIPISGTLGFNKAEVTAGGVSLDEVDSSTMQSKRCPGLYLAGEILDLDGPIGGYNFQAAFSTGWLAGAHA